MTHTEKGHPNEDPLIPSTPENSLPISDFRLLFEAMPDPCLVLDTNLRIVSANRAYLNATMTKPEKILGRGVFDIFPDNPADPDATGVRNLSVSLNRVLRYGVTDVMAVQKYDVRTPEEEGGDFEERYWSPTNVPVFRADNQMAYIIHRVQDVTEYVHLKQKGDEEHKVIEEQRERAVHVEAEIYAKTQEVAKANSEIKRLNDAIAERSAELETANLELEAFNYSAAHDLRQPLNLISSYVQAIEMQCADTLPKECVSYVEGIHNSNLRMNRLIETLLNFSRLTRVEPAKEPIDLCAMAKEVAMTLKSGEPERQVDFLIPDGITASADANLMGVVLDNLLGNAWKYTGKREHAVIEFGASEINGKSVYFVRDNGVGFNKAQADLLFAPFKRLSGAEEFRGFGIGLATVQRIIQKHGGQVWAESEPDKGATFYFTLSGD